MKRFGFNVLGGRILPIRSLGPGSPGCKAGVEILAQNRPPTSAELAQVIVSSELTVIRPGRLSQQVPAESFVNLLVYSTDEFNPFTIVLLDSQFQTV